MNAAAWAATAAGIGLLALVGLDIYGTILHSRGRSGPVTEALTRGVWRVMRALAFRRERSGRHRLLSNVGPLLLPGLVTALVALLIAGYALLYWPHLATDFTIEEKARSPSGIEALYFSGITFTTLGYGDIAPRSASMRLLALSEALTGFGFISLAVTYLVSLTAALERKRSVALSFYHQARQGADVAGLLVHHFVNGRFVGLERIFADAARDLQGLLESHVEHPLIHYFHPTQVHKSLPRMLFLVLETCAVTRACLDDQAYEELCRHPELRTLDETARHVLSELASAVGVGRGTAIAEDEPGREGVPTVEEPARWRRRFEDTLRRLRKARVRLASDSEKGWREYGRRRHGWELELAGFALFLGYDWDEVTGDGGLRLAAEEEGKDNPTLPLIEEPEAGPSRVSELN
jgi:Ion channel